MSDPIPNLWPEDFGDGTTPSPAGILRRQGQLLGQRTQNVVFGKVYSRAVDNKTFEHTFAVVAPLLGFERPVMSVTHALELFPVRIAIDPIVAPGGGQNGAVYEARTIDEFVSQLGDIFKSEPMKAVVRSLLAQSQGRPVAASASNW